MAKKKIDKDLAVRACQLLIAAYDRGVDGDYIEWNDVDQAYRVALKAFSEKR